jgi:flagellar motor switch protein FliN/FliY
MAKKDATPRAEKPAAPAMAEQALHSAQEALSDLKSQSGTPPPPGARVHTGFTPGLPATAGVAPAAPGAGQEAMGAVPEQPRGIELLSDVNLNVKIELGRTRMLVEDVLRLSEGAVVELDKLAGDPVDVYVNDRPVARGEVLVLNDNFCVRINEIIAGGEAERVAGRAARRAG